MGGPLRGGGAGTDRYTVTNMQKVAITGASGFIGRHVLPALAARDVAIVATSRTPERLKQNNPGIHVVQMDIAAPGDDCYERLGKPDVLIHLAWDGLPNYKSAHHLERELPQHVGFLGAMIKAGLPELLVTGTCFEYGMQSGALSEKHPPQPRNPYGQAKDALRQNLEQLRTKYRYALTWARLFYMFGEDQPESSLYPQLRKAVARGEPVFNMSGGEQIRDYLPVDTVASILAELALTHADTGTVNVCSGKPVTVRHMVESWVRENGWDIEPNLGHYPYPDYEPMKFWGENGYLQSIMNDHPQQF